MVSSFIGMAARRAISSFRSASLFHSRGLSGLNSQPKVAKALVLTSAAAASAFLSFGGYKFITEEARLRRDLETFESWMKEHNKVYASPEEKKQRFQIFRGELRFIERNKAVSAYKLGLNARSDLTDEEFKKGCGCLVKSSDGATSSLGVVACSEEKMGTFRIFRGELRFTEERNKDVSDYKLG